MAALQKSSLRLQGQRPAAVSRSALRVSAKVAAKSAAKAKSSNAPYVCVDCGYLYDGKKGAFEDLPKSYACPVCGAPKNRFKQFLGNVSRSNDNKTMSNRRDALREQLEERGESVGEDPTFLVATAASAAIFLGAVYYFTVLGR